VLEVSILFLSNDVSIRFWICSNSIVPVSKQEKKQTCICVLELSILFLSNNVSIRFWMCSNSIVPVSKQEKKRTCICVLELSILFISNDFSIRFWMCSNSIVPVSVLIVWYFCFSFYYMVQTKSLSKCKSQFSGSLYLNVNHICQDTL